MEYLIFGNDGGEPKVTGNYMAANFVSFRESKI